jgi:hypothetical protein
MKSVSHFENFACPAALRRVVSCPPTIRRFPRLIMINPTTLQHPPMARSGDPLPPTQPSPYSAHMQFPQPHRVRRKRERLPSDGFIERAHQHLSSHTPPSCARPIKHLRYSPTMENSIGYDC